jgi:LysR family transcriptional regulator, transcriptional activator for aaeXAB operon
VVRVGTLEGLSFIALHMVKGLLENDKVKVVELDVFDQNELEQKFLNGDLDLILSSRTPGKQKFKHLLELGHQTFKIVR